MSDEVAGGAPGATAPSLRLVVLDERLAVCRLEPDAGIPAWATAGDFFSVTRTEDELSVVCPEEYVPEGTVCERVWRALKVEGPLDFSLVGVMASLTAPLAERGVSVFTIATHDTDYALVNEENLDLAVAALGERGHEVT